MIVPCELFKVLQINHSGIPRECNSLIIFTCKLVNLAKGCLSPCLVLPFLVLSIALSKCVPSTKCSGFTHLGLSHECITIFPFGICPL